MTPKQREHPSSTAQAMGIEEITVRSNMQGTRRFYGTRSTLEALARARKRGDL